MSARSTAAAVWNDERDRLLSIAYRMLGDFGHAEDVVSEVAIDALHAEAVDADVRSWPAWLTTACVRRAIDRLRQLSSSREDYTGPWLPEPVATDLLPEDVVANRELISIALLHLAEQLTPEARAAVVLHRAFGLTSSEIAPILERSPAAVRQLISRGERRLRISRDAAPTRAADPALLASLVTAIEAGEIGHVVSLLESDAILWTDGGGRTPAALNPIFGAEHIARFFLGILERAFAAPGTAPSAAVVSVNGEAALSLTLRGVVDVLALELTETGSVRGLRRISNPEKLTRAFPRPARPEGGDPADAPRQAGAT